MGTTKKMPTKYLDIIKKSEQEVEAQTLVDDNDAAAIQMDRDILSARQTVNDKVKEVNRLRGARPFNSVSLLVAQRQLKKSQEDFEELTAMKAEMF